MSLYGDAIAASKAVVVIDERVQSAAKQRDKLADEVRDMKDRSIRLETVVEIVRSDRGVLRISQPPE